MKRPKLTLYGIVQQWIAGYRRDGFILNKSRIRRIRRLASIAWGQHAQLTLAAKPAEKGHAPTT
jgi:hypothetical protein